jgi:hypothetical protein
MSFFGYAILLGAAIGVFIGVWRYIPWFGPICSIILISFLGYGILVEVIVRTANPAMWFQIVPAAIFFGIGGLACLWIKRVPQYKLYGAILFFGACGICGLLLLKGAAAS